MLSELRMLIIKLSAIPDIRMPIINLSAIPDES